MTDLETEALPSSVGLVLWRHTPGGREVCTLDLEGRAVLPKGIVLEGENELEAARRLACNLCDASTEDEIHVIAPTCDIGRVSWWQMRWAGPSRVEPAQRNAELYWFDTAEATIYLARLGERELLRGHPLPIWRRALHQLRRPQRARAQRANWRQIDERARIRELPEENGARLRGEVLMQRVVDAAALSDHGAAREVRAELHRLELQARPEQATALARAAEVRQAAAQELQLHRDRVALGLVLAAALAAVAVLGPHEDQWLMLTLFGLIGGACSALRAYSALPALLRPVLGSVAANLVHAFLSGSTLVQFSPAGWLLTAFAAGFAERWLSRPQPGGPSPPGPEPRDREPS